MEKKYSVEEIKKERSGILFRKNRTTSRDSNGKIGVSDWKDTESEAIKQSRERLSEPKKDKE